MPEDEDTTEDDVAHAASARAYARQAGVRRITTGRKDATTPPKGHAFTPEDWPMPKARVVSSRRSPTPADVRTLNVAIQAMAAALRPDAMVDDRMIEAARHAHDAFAGWRYVDPSDGDAKEREDVATLLGMYLRLRGQAEKQATARKAKVRRVAEVDDAGVRKVEVPGGTLPVAVTGKAIVAQLCAYFELGMPRLLRAKRNCERIALAIDDHARHVGLGGAGGTDGARTPEVLARFIVNTVWKAEQTSREARRARDESRVNPRQDRKK